MSITLHQSKYFAHDLTRRAANGMDRLSMALFDAAVDLNPHQIESALFALQSPLSKGVILADEVGLGKTIEAGIVAHWNRIVSTSTMPVKSLKSGPTTWCFQPKKPFPIQKS